MKRVHLFLMSVLLSAAPVWGQPPPLLFDFGRVQHQPGEVTTPESQKVPTGSVELVDGQFGKACKFSFVASTGPQFFTAWVNPSEDWDQYEGFSFWVKGDVLVMTTCPGFAAWETRNELCVAAYEAAQERKTGFVDAATAFHKAGSREEALRRQYWAWDNVHLGPGGHELIAETVFAAIGSGGAGDLRLAREATGKIEVKQGIGQTE